MSNNTHGLTKHPLYVVWYNAKQRCNNPKNDYYKNYGGRGITFFTEWANSFIHFYDWAIVNGFKEGLTLDRKNVNGNYEPSNCRFVTLKVQMNNRTSNRIITYNQETKTLSEWADYLNMNYEVLKFRIQNGWTTERAFNQKVRRSKCS